jgi:hypothetical protein
MVLDKDFFDRVKPTYKHKMAMIKWKASQWMQYIGYEYNREGHSITLRFKSSNYGISFEITERLFTHINEEEMEYHISFSEAYNYFKKVKYEECEM